MKNDSDMLKYEVLVLKEQVKSLQKKIQDHQSLSEFLIDSAKQLSRIETIKALYSYATEILYEMIGKKGIVTFVEFDNESDLWKMQHIEGMSEVINKISKLFGSDVMSMSGNIRNAYYESLTSGKLVQMDFDLGSLTNGMISSELNKPLLKIFPVKKLFSISFVADKVSYGNISIITTNESDYLDKEIVEAFVKQVAIFVKKLKTEQDYQTSSENFKIMADNLDQVFWLTDWQKKELIYVSPSFERAFELPVKAAYDDRMNWLKVIHPDDLQRVQHTFETAARNEVYCEEEYRIVTPSGKIKWIIDRSHPIYDDNRKLIKFVSIAEDITDRKMAELALLESESRFRSLFSNSFSGTIYIDPKGNVLEANPKMLEILGSPSLPETQKINMFTFPPLVKAGYSQALREAIDTGKIVTGENSYKSKWGKEVYVKYYFNPIKSDGQVVGVLGNVEDLTKTIEKENTFKKILQTVPDPLTVIELDTGKCIEVNRSFTELTGWEAEETIGKTASDLDLWVNEKDRKRMIKTVQEKGWITGFETSFKTKDGKLLATIISVSIVVLNGVKCLITVSKDISARKNAEMGLQESERKYRNIFRFSPVGITHYDAEGNIIDLNDKVLKILGADREDALCVNLLNDLKNQHFVEAVKKSLSDGEGSFEGWYEAVHGEKKSYIKATFKGIFDEAGKISGGIELMEDFTAGEIREFRLQQTESKFESLFENMLNAFAYHKIITNDQDEPVDYQFLEVNKAFEEMTGLKRANIIGRNVTEVLPGTENDPADWINRYARVALQGEQLNFESYSQEIDKWFHIVAFSPSREYFVTIFEDITERKITESKLSRSEELFRSLIQAVPDLIIRTDIDGTITFTNDQILTFKDLLTNEQVVGKNIFSFISDKDKQRAIQNTRIMFEKPLGVQEYQVITSDGTCLECEVNGDVIHNENMEPVGMVYIIRDITRRKHMAADLKENEEKYKNIITLAPVGFYQSSPEGVIITANQKLAEILGYEAVKKLMQLNMRDLYYEQNRNEIIEKFDLNGKEEIFNLEVQFRHKNGEPIWVSLTSQAIKDDQGRTKYYDGFVIDITERKRAEKQIRESEIRYKTLAEQIPNGAIFLFDKDYRYILVAGKALKAIGLSPEDCIGKTMYEVFPPEITETVDNVNEKTFNGESYYFENEIKGRTFGVWGTPVLNEEGEVVEGLNYAMDITDLKSKENALQDAIEQKDLLLKELYHRTKNNMQVIASMLRLRSRTLKDPSQTEYFLEMVNKINSMSLVHQKLYSAQDLTQIDLKDYLEDFLKLMLSSYNVDTDRIKIDLDLESVFTPVDVSIPLGLVLSELLSNVFKHAFPDARKGVLKITLQREKDKQLFLEIADNGKGIPAGMDLREAGGLGLQNALNLIEYQLKGKIEYKAKKGLKWQIWIDDKSSKKRI